MCTDEDITLTSTYEACFDKRRYPKDIDSCRKGYDSILNSLGDAFPVDEIQVQSVESVNAHDISVEVEHDTLLTEQDCLDNIATVAIDECENPIYHEQTNVDESVHKADTSFEIEHEALDIDTIAETLDTTKTLDNVTVVVESGESIYHEPNHTKDLSSSILEEVAAQETVHLVSNFLMANSSGVLNTNSTLDLVEYVNSGYLPRLEPDYIFATQPTIPCLNDEIHLSFVGDNGTSGLLDDELTGQEIDSAYDHNIVDVSSIEISFIIIISFAMLVGCWLIFQIGSSAIMRAGIYLGRTSTFLSNTTRFIGNGGVVLMNKLVSLFGHGLNTATRLIRLLLWPIESSLNAIIALKRWLCYMYGPQSRGRSLSDIMFKSNPKQGCIVASTFNAIVQCLIDTGQASLLKLIRLPFNLARLGLALVAKSCTLVFSVVHCLVTTAEVSLLKLTSLLLEVLRSVGATAATSCNLVLLVAASISKAIGVYLQSIRAAIFFGLAHLVLRLKSYARVISIILSIVSETARVYLHYFQGLIFVLTCLVSDTTIKSYTLVLSVEQYFLKTIGQVCPSICNTTRSLVRLVTKLLTIGVSSTSSLIKLAIEPFRFVLTVLLLVPQWYWEFGPYSQGQSMFDILFKSNPERRFMRATSRLNNIKASSSSDQYRLWYMHKPFDPGISSTVHRGHSSIPVVNKLFWICLMYIRVPFAAPDIVDRVFTIKHSSVTRLSASCHNLAIRRSFVGRSMNKFHIIIILAIKCLIFIGMSSALTLDNGVSAAHYPFQ